MILCFVRFGNLLPIDKNNQINLMHGLYSDKQEQLNTIIYLYLFFPFMILIRDGWYLNFQVPNSVLYVILESGGFHTKSVSHWHVSQRILVIFWSEYITQECVFTVIYCLNSHIWLCYNFIYLSYICILKYIILYVYRMAISRNKQHMFLWSTLKTAQNLIIQGNKINK